MFSGTGYGHLYLVYKNDAGSEFVIRGGPDTFINEIVTEAGVPIELSEDLEELTLRKIERRAFWTLAISMPMMFGKFCYSTPLISRMDHWNTIRFHRIAIPWLHQC